MKHIQYLVPYEEAAKSRNPRNIQYVKNSARLWFSDIYGITLEDTRPENELSSETGTLNTHLDLEKDLFIMKYVPNEGLL